MHFVTFQAGCGIEIIESCLCVRERERERERERFSRELLIFPVLDEGEDLHKDEQT